jgi:hypothetical protein
MGEFSCLVLAEWGVDEMMQRRKQFSIKTNSLNENKISSLINIRIFLYIQWGINDG